MAEKEITNVVKLQIEAGKATPAPPVGPALGSTGINIMQFTKEFNDKTADKAGLVIPVVVTIMEDRSFSFILKTPPAAAPGTPEFISQTLVRVWADAPVARSAAAPASIKLRKVFFILILI